jgi:two-component system cell cycle response regulator
MTAKSSSIADQDRKYAAWKILLVGAEPTQNIIMARLLKRAGFEVETAGNGREALAKIEAGDFQLMITDWEMPEMDGIALCSALRKSPNQAYIFIILFTARDSIEHVVTGLQAGADDYLTKPVIEPELIARLSTGKRIVTLERSLRTANEENRRLSITDALTGTCNRRYLMEQLPREISRAIRFNRCLSVIMCDIDDFKAVNDTYGHASGGEVLAGTATLLAQGIRSSDWVATNGGDEFYVVLPETPLSLAHRAAELLRRDLSEATMLPRHSGVRVTASFGVVGWEAEPSSEVTAEDVLRAVDRCVYESKSSGRNRVTIKAFPHSASAA